MEPRRAPTRRLRRSTSAPTIDNPTNVPLFAYGQFLGQFWDAFDDLEAGRTGSVRFTVQKMANIASDATVPPRHLVGEHGQHRSPLPSAHRQRSADPRPRRLRRTRTATTLLVQTIRVHRCARGRGIPRPRQRPAVGRQQPVARPRAHRLRQLVLVACSTQPDHSARRAPLRARGDGPDDAVRRLSSRPKGSTSSWTARPRAARSTQTNGFTIGGAVTVTFGDVLYHEGAETSCLRAGTPTGSLPARTRVHRDEAALGRPRLQERGPRPRGTRQTFRAPPTDGRPRGDQSIGVPCSPSHRATARQALALLRLLPFAFDESLWRRDRAGRPVDGSSVEAGDATRRPTPTPHSARPAGGASSALAQSSSGPPPDVTNRFADDRAAAALGPETLLRSFVFRAAARHGQRRQPRDARALPGQTGRVACAGCHIPASGFSDTRSFQLQISLGAGWGRRRAPSLLDVGQATLVMWDGKRDTLYDQIFGPLETVVEMNSSRLYMAEQLYAEYQSDYEAVFGPMPPLDDTTQFPPLSADADRVPTEEPTSPPPTCDGTFHGMPGDHAEFDGMTAANQTAVTQVVVNAGKAIGAFERLLTCGPTPFDAWMQAGRGDLARGAARGRRVRRRRQMRLLPLGAVHEDQTVSRRGPRAGDRAAGLHRFERPGRRHRPCIRDHESDQLRKRLQRRQRRATPDCGHARDERRLPDAHDALRRACVRRSCTPASFKPSRTSSRSSTQAAPTTDTRNERNTASRADCAPAKRSRRVPRVADGARRFRETPPGP